MTISRSLSLETSRVQSESPGESYSDLPHHQTTWETNPTICHVSDAKRFPLKMAVEHHYSTKKLDESGSDQEKSRKLEIGEGR